MGTLGDPMKRAVALYRSEAYSPNQHRANDRAILDLVVEQLVRSGWEVLSAGEEDVAAGHLPPSPVYLNMCQGPAASERLRMGLPGGATCVNTPDAVLRCHRHRLIPILRRAGLPFPRTRLLHTVRSGSPAGSLGGLFANGHPVWVKRGDVHAQSAADVVAAQVGELPGVIAGFAARGIDRVAIQAHVPGPVVKFYGVDRSLLHAYYAEEGGPLGPGPVRDALGRLGARAARLVGLAVYGGDAVLTPNGPVLIDLNDWPSFAPVRAQAAAAIARLVNRRAQRGRFACPIP